MSEKTADHLCEHCDDEPATEIEDFGEGIVKLCENCQMDLPFDEYTHERVTEIVDNINGYDVGQYTVDHHTITCDWSGDLCLEEFIIELGNGDLIHSMYEDEIGHCHDCGHTTHNDNLIHHNSTSYDYCEECLPKEGDRWSTRFTKRECLNYRKYPVRNYVGMEFESETDNTDGTLQGYGLSKYLAEAKEDGSLNTGSIGTEYVSHPLQGEDILECIEKTCDALANEEFYLSTDVGWHFHYDVSALTNKRLKNVWNAMEKFSDMMKDYESQEYGYFQSMLRHYSENWNASYRRWASNWAKSDTRESYATFYGDGGRNQGRYVWANFEPIRRGQDTIEIRMYQPSAYRRTCTNNADWDSEMYKLLADDYSKFIRFFHEFIRKSAYNPAGMRFFDENNEPLTVKRFASQFTEPVAKWLVQRNKDYMRTMRRSSR